MKRKNIKEKTYSFRTSKYDKQKNFSQDHIFDFKVSAIFFLMRW